MALLAVKDIPQVGPLQWGWIRYQEGEFGGPCDLDLPPVVWSDRKNAGRCAAIIVRRSADVEDGRQNGAPVLERLYARPGV